MNSTELAFELVSLLKAQNKRVTTVESCTGGLMAAAITSVSGASDVFDFGFVTYSNAAKSTLVGVQQDLLTRHGAVSLEVAAAMAEGALTSAGAALALSVTGIAGPSGGSPEKPVGTVCFGLSYLDRDDDGIEPMTQAVMERFGAVGRDEVRNKSVAFALKWAIDTLKA